MKTDLLLLAFLLLSAPAAAQQATKADYRELMGQMMKSGDGARVRPQSWDARLKVISGGVAVKTADSPDWHKITRELPLEPGDVVKTSGDGAAEIYFDDKGAASLGPSTELAVSSLDQQNAALSLEQGSIAAKIRRFLDEKQRLEVRTRSAVCSARGGEFAAEYSPLSKETSVGVFDQAGVTVTPQLDSGKPGDALTLEKNTEITINPEDKRFHAEQLFRMGRFRGTIGAMRRRLLALRRWRPRASAVRARLREAALKGLPSRQLSKKRVSRSGKAPSKRRPRSRRRTQRNYAPEVQ